MKPTRKLSTGNLFGAPEAPLSGEVFTDLLRCQNVRIERIVSSECPEPTLHDQKQDEWVCLLQGEADLWLNGKRIALCAGDHVFIPAHTPHRVLRTSGHPPCVWLAVHIHPGHQDTNADPDTG